MSMGFKRPEVRALIALGAELVREEEDGSISYIPGDLVRTGYDAALAAAILEIEAEAEQPVPIRLSFLEFMDLFTGDEQLALAGAAMTDPPTKLWYDRAVGAQFIDLSDSRLSVGMQAMVDAAIISADRMARVLQGLPPAS